MFVFDFFFLSLLLIAMLCRRESAGKMQASKIDDECCLAWSEEERERDLADVKKEDEELVEEGDGYIS